MLLGKRPRQPIKRTTSVTEFNFDHSAGHGTQPDQNLPPPYTLGGSDKETVSPRIASRRNASDYVPSSINSGDSVFLRACSLCNRRLVPGRDIYMYRGDRGYCSQECRQKQVNHDEKKAKATATRCSVAAAAKTNKQQASSSSTTSSSPASSNTESIAAMR